MAYPSVEERLATVELELAQLKQRLGKEGAQTTGNNWEKIFGTFANSKGFDEAVHLGRKYRSRYARRTTGKIEDWSV